MDPQPSRLHVEVQGRALALDGVLDSHTADRLDETLERLGDDGDVDVDFSAVTFVDSSGLRAILAANGRLSAVGHELRLVAPQEPVRRLLAITNLDAYLRVVEDPGLGRAGRR
ncbi:MAG: STAS domain-containing protein [Acidimicrobiales bacterium]